MLHPIISKRVVRNLETHFVFMDLQRAYDTAPHYRRPSECVLLSSVFKICINEVGQWKCTLVLTDDQVVLTTDKDDIC